MAGAFPPVLLVTGAKDTGKTTLLVELLRRLRRGGRVLYAFKRATEVERPDASGTDTARFAEGGADIVGLTWPRGSYVAYFGSSARPPTPVADRRLGRPSSLEELVALAAAVAAAGNPGAISLQGAPGAAGPEAVVLAEGFSDTSYPRLHVLPRPGQPGRPAEGPVLATWTLASSAQRPRVKAIADLVDVSLPLLASWSQAFAASGPGGPSRPGGPPPPGGMSVVAAVLAGGKGRRLGSRDKWLIEVGGKVQGERCLEALSDLFAWILVVGRDANPAGGAPRASASPPGGARRGASVRWVPDLYPRAGPLGGLLSALAVVPGHDVFVVAGDMPFLSRPFIRHLIFSAARHAGTFDVHLPSWGSYVEPLHALYAASCLERLRGLMSTPAAWPGRRVTTALEGLRVRPVPEDEIRLFGEPEVLFLNLNTPEDLARAEVLASTNQKESS